MDVEQALPELRREAESIMRSRVIVRRRTGETRDHDTGRLIPTFTVIYTGPARVRIPSLLPREVVQAGQRVVTTAPTASFPIGDADAARIRLDDEIVLVQHAPDPHRAGTVLRVVSGTDQTWSTARRFDVEITTATQRGDQP